MPVPVRGNLDGVTIYDTLAGPSAALRWHDEQSWKQFELIREVPSDREFRIKIALNGLGEVRFDDLKVVAFDPPREERPWAKGPEPRAEESPSRGLDFLPRLPKLAPLPNRNRPTSR
jgi:hypothetical protein